jgi:hypothetical protein
MDRAALAAVGMAVARSVRKTATRVRGRKHKPQVIQPNG